MSATTGKCLCGAVRYTAASAPKHHHVCHCGMCRRWSGGPVFAANVRGVTFEAEEHISRYRSSDWAERGFCKQCGSHLFYYLVPAQIYMMCVGSLDDAAALVLSYEVFIDEKPEGYGFAGDHPRLTGAEAIAKYSG
jgi:hypothetical protein